MGCIRDNSSHKATMKGDVCSSAACEIHKLSTNKLNKLAHINMQLLISAKPTMVGLPVAPGAFFCKKILQIPILNLIPIINCATNNDFLHTHHLYWKISCPLQAILHKDRFSAVLSQTDTGFPVSEALGVSLRQESILTRHFGQLVARRSRWARFYRTLLGQMVSVLQLAIHWRENVRFSTYIGFTSGSKASVLLCQAIVFLFQTGIWF